MNLLLKTMEHIYSCYHCKAKRDYEQLEIIKYADKINLQLSFYFLCKDKTICKSREGTNFIPNDEQIELYDLIVNLHKATL